MNETRARHLKKSPPGGPVEHFQSDDLTLSDRLITELALDFPIERLCKMLNVGRSAYYAYQAGQSHRLTEGKEKLRQAMLNSFTDHRRR
ncbi:hypothetical protein [Spirosoma areae]